MSYLTIADVDWEILKVGDFVLGSDHAFGKISKLYEEAGVKYVTVMWSPSGGSICALSRKHSVWEDWLWVGLGLDFIEDDGSVSIQRNDIVDF